MGKTGCGARGSTQLFDEQQCKAQEGEKADHICHRGQDDAGALGGVQAFLTESLNNGSYSAAGMICLRRIR